VILGEIIFADHLFKGGYPSLFLTFKTAFLEIATRFYKEYVNFIVHGLIMEIAQNSKNIYIVVKIIKWIA
jgi:hypothetical protein